MLKNLANTAVNFSLPVTCAVRYEVLLIRLESRLTREDFFFFPLNYSVIFIHL